MIKTITCQVMLKQHGQHFVTPLHQLLQAWISTLSKRVGINSQNKTNQHAAVLDCVQKFKSTHIQSLHIKLIKGHVITYLQTGSKYAWACTKILYLKRSKMYNF